MDPLWNSIMRFGFFAITLLLVDGLKEAHARERLPARRDPLTETLNSREFAALVAGDVERTRRLGRPFALAYVDLDRFKSVNDSLGHPAGDLLLRAAAAELRENVRRMDAVARLGGDEFGLLLPDSGLDQTVLTLERVLPAVWRELARRWSAGRACLLQPASAGALAEASLTPAEDAAPA